MPNWCTNTIRINRKTAEEFLLSKGKNDNGKEIDVVDFNKLIPMPESLLVTSGSTNERDIYMYLSDHNNKAINKDTKGYGAFDAINPLGFDEQRLSRIAQQVIEACNDPKTKEESYQAGKVLVENYEKYGACTWYEWANEHWGTKWNAGECQIEDVGNGKVEINFDTAWCPPEGILAELAKHGDFDLSYDIECNGYGTLEGRGGTLRDTGYEPFDYGDFEGSDYEIDEPEQ